jgi:hypothetical protein
MQLISRIILTRFYERTCLRKENVVHSKIVYFIFINTTYVDAKDFKKRFG